MEKIDIGFGVTTEAEPWNGTDVTGHHWEAFTEADTENRDYRVDPAGNVYYRNGDGTYSLWCSAEHLGRHIHHLNQILWRR